MSTGVGRIQTLDRLQADGARSLEPGARNSHLQSLVNAQLRK